MEVLVSLGKKQVNTRRTRAGITSYLLDNAHSFLQRGTRV